MALSFAPERPMLGDLLARIGYKSAPADATGSVMARLKELLDRATATRMGYLDAAITSRAERGLAATYFAVASGLTPFLDTGQLAAGEYEIVASGAFFGNNGSFGACYLEHRNAANTGNVKSLIIARTPSSGTMSTGYTRWPRVTVALNERFRLHTPDITPVSGESGISLFVRVV